MNFNIIEIDKNKPTHLKLLVKKSKTNSLDPILELYRGKLYICLLKSFINDCIDNFGKEIFSIKKSFTRTITNILSGWIFSLYINYDFSGDYFLPNNYGYTKQLEETLLDLCKYNSSILNNQDKINYVITRLRNNYKKQLELLEQYQGTESYKKSKNNYKIKKTVVSIKKNNDQKETLFYKLEILTSFFIRDKKLETIINNILLPTKVYDKLNDNYSGPKNKIDDYIWSIIFRYQLLSSNNNQLAVLPSIMHLMHNDYQLNFECFASAINSVFKNYCSIYYDLEQYFGSVGSFFSIIPVKGTFGFNPPYQKDLIDASIKKVIGFLKNAPDNLTFIVTIPIWDKAGQKIMKELYNNGLEKQNIDYGEFEIINLMKMSGFMKGIRMIPKEKFTYIDHSFELYKNKTIQNTYVIILSNTDIKTDMLEGYDFQTFH